MASIKYRSFGPCAFLASAVALTACGGGDDATDASTDGATKQSEEGLNAASSAQLQDSWSVHFDCKGAKDNGFSPPTMQVHYHEWQTVPWVSTVLRGVNGYAFYANNPNWRVRRVTIRIYDTARGALIDSQSWSYGGTRSATNAPFSPLLGVTKGKQRVVMELSTYSDECTGTLSL